MRPRQPLCFCPRGAGILLPDDANLCEPLSNFRAPINRPIVDHQDLVRWTRLADDAFQRFLQKCCTVVRCNHNAVEMCPLAGIARPLASGSPATDELAAAAGRSFKSKLIRCLMKESQAARDTPHLIV